MEKVYIAFPVAMSGKIDIRVIQLLIQAQDRYEVIIGCEIGHQIAHNRNRLVKKFLETDCEWIFFIDTDTIPPLNIMDMTEHKLDICSGYYYQWTQRQLMPLIFKEVEGGYIADVGRPTDIPNVVEVDATGAGCLLVNRRVFEKIEKPYFLTPYNDEGEALSTEDIYFFKKVKKAGYKIFLDKSMVARHVKTVDLTEIAE